MCVLYGACMVSKGNTTRRHVCCVIGARAKRFEKFSFRFSPVGAIRKQAHTSYLQIKLYFGRLVGWLWRTNGARAAAEHKGLAFRWRQNCRKRPCPVGANFRQQFLRKKIKIASTYTRIKIMRALWWMVRSGLTCKERQPTKLVQCSVIHRARKYVGLIRLLEQNLGGCEKSELTQNFGWETCLGAKYLSGRTMSHQSPHPTFQWPLTTTSFY